MRMSIEQEFAAWEADLGAFWWCAGGLGRFRGVRVRSCTLVVLRYFMVLLGDCCCCRHLLFVSYP